MARKNPLKNHELFVWCLFFILWEEKKNLIAKFPIAKKNKKTKKKIPVFSQLEESFGFLEKEEEQPTCASCAFTAASCRRGEHGDAEEFLAQICLFFSFLLTRCV